ncbi:hypothetical protein [Synechococcus sp. UW105]|uniref:hypothetical protein n=1 Tax=Synechococcus sp. UW105 TaxID=337067 RepID=UPI000E0E9BA6|nr:hypothetical protein [Synechococcus sp. UW105]
MANRSFAIAFVLACASLFAPCARALEPDAVDAKFQTVTVLTPVTEAGELKPLKQAGMVAFFSTLAADLFAQQWRQRTGETGEFRVAPLALTQFEAAFLKARESDSSLTKAYVPDPAQIPAVVGLQLQQGVELEQARSLAQQQPYVICPDPLVRITQTQDGKSSTIVPCAFTFTSMALLVNRSNQEAQSPTVLKAYSLQEMVQFLTEQSGEDARNLTIASPIAQPADQAASDSSD